MVSNSAQKIKRLYNTITKGILHLNFTTTKGIYWAKKRFGVVLTEKKVKHRRNYDAEFIEEVPDGIEGPVAHAETLQFTNRSLT